MLLPTVSTNTFAGLMEALAAEPFNGKADLPELAAALHYEADELLSVAETLRRMLGTRSPRCGPTSSWWRA